MEQNIDGTRVIFQGGKQITLSDHSDDDVTNLFPKPATLYVNPDASGVIKVILAGEDTPRTINSWEALVGSIVVKKVYANVTTVSLDDIKAYI